MVASSLASHKLEITSLFQDKSEKKENTFTQLMICFLAIEFWVLLLGIISTLGVFSGN